MSRRPRTPLDGIPGAPPPAPDPFPVSKAALEVKQATLLTPAFVHSLFAPHLGGLRSRKLPLPLMALLLLAFCLHGQLPSFTALLEELAEGSLAGLQALTVSPQAFYQRLQALGHARFLFLFQQVTAHLRSNPGRRGWVAALASFARGLYAVDDTTLDALVRRVPELRDQLKGSPGTLGGKLASVQDLCTGKLVEVLYNPDSTANEKTHLLPLLRGLGVGALVVLDLGYFAFPLFDAITEAKQYFVTRMPKVATFKVVQVLVDLPLYRDRIVYLGANRSDQAAHPVRLVELYLEGEWWRYLTNVLDPHALPGQAVWRLYLERWGIEQAFFALKRVVGLCSLRCSTLDGVLAQVWASLTVFQVLQDLRLEIAAAQGMGAEDVSWERLVRRIEIYSRVPEPKPPMREWLLTRERLEKRGVRKRKATELPAEVLQAIQEGTEKAPDPESVSPRTPRQGKPCEVRPAIHIEAGLSQTVKIDPD